MPNQLVQWWRQNNPEDSGLSDDQVTLKLADLAPAYKDQGQDLFSQYPDFASDYESILGRAEMQGRKASSTLMGEVGRGVSRGISGLKSTAYGAAALAADVVPGTFADPVRDAMIRRYKAAQEEAGARDVVAAVPSYKNVEDVSDAARYAAGLIGEAVPSIVESVGTGIVGAVAGTAVEPGGGTVAGGIGGLIGKQAAKRLIAKKIAGYTAEEIEEAALKGVGSEALKQLVRAETKAIAAGAGAAIANTINSYGLSAGEIYGDLATNPNVNPEDALGIALTAAVPAAIADTALPSYVLKKSGALNRLAGAMENFGETERRGFIGYLARLGGESLKTVPMESATEAFQELVNIAASKYAETGSFDLGLTPEEKERIINAAAGGAAGGLVAAPSAAARFDKKEPEAKPQESAVQPVAEEQAAAPAAAAPVETAKDVLEDYGINIDAIKDLASRKLNGDDVTAEEANLPEPAKRRYQQEVIEQSAAKAKAEAEVAPEAETAGQGEKPAGQAEQGLDFRDIEYVDSPEYDNATGTVNRTSGSAQVVDMADRKIVLVNVNGVPIPFYLSTGRGGKANVAAGKWYPILGIGPTSGWFNKGSQSEINDYYGSPTLRAIAERLDRELGKDVPAKKVGPSSILNSVNAGLATIGITPIDNDDSGARKTLDQNIAKLQTFLNSSQNQEQAASEASASNQKPSEDNANKEPSTVEVPGGEGAAPSAQVAEGKPEEVQDTAEEDSEEELDPNVVAAKRVLDKKSKAAKSSITRIEREIKSLEDKAKVLVEELRPAEELLARYTEVESMEKSPSKDAAKKQLNKQLKKYGNISGLQKYIDSRNIVERDSKGRATLLLKSQNRDSRKTVAFRLSSLVKKLNTEQVKLISIEDDIENVSGKTVMPSYYDSEQDSDASSELNRLYSESLRATGIDKRNALEELGRVLTADAREKNFNQRFSRRLTAWTKLDKEAGGVSQVLVTTSHRDPLPKGDSNPASRYVFAVTSPSVSEVDGKRKITKATVKTVSQLIDEGYRPYASILVNKSRERSAQTFTAVPANEQEGSPAMSAIEAFNQAFDKARKQEDTSEPVSLEEVVSDGKDDIVDRAAKDAAEVLSDKELEVANDYFFWLNQSFVEEAANLVNEGKYDEAVKGTVIGRMVDFYDACVAEKLSQKEILARFAKEFSADIRSYLQSTEGYVNEESFDLIADELPSMISASAIRREMRIRNDKMAMQMRALDRLKNKIKSEEKTTDESNQSAGSTAPGDAAGKTGKAGADGGRDRKGNRVVAKENPEAIKAKAGKAAAGQGRKAVSASDRADLAKFEAKKKAAIKKAEVKFEAAKKKAGDKLSASLTKLLLNKTASADIVFSKTGEIAGAIKSKFTKTKIASLAKNIASITDSYIGKQIDSMVDKDGGEIAAGINSIADQYISTIKSLTEKRDSDISSAGRSDKAKSMVAAFKSGDYKSFNKGIGNKPSETKAPAPSKAAKTEAKTPKKEVKKEEPKKPAPPENKDTSLQDAKNDALERIGRLVEKKTISSKDGSKLSAKVAEASKTDLVGLIAQLVSIESDIGTPERKKVADISELIESLQEDGVIDGDAKKNLLKRVKKASSDMKTLKSFERELKAIASRGSRSRLAQSDPDAIDQVDLETGALTSPELVPNSISNIISNIARFAMPMKLALRQPITSETARTNYPDLRTSLRRIAVQAASEGTPTGAIRAAVAKAMMDRAEMTGVSISFSDDQGLLAGSYDIGGDSIKIYAANHTSDSDLQATILEESLHAFTSKIRLAASSNPDSLSQPLRDAVIGIEKLIDIALKNNLTWQQSNSTDRAVVFDEFVAASMRDNQFQSKLSGISLSEDFGVKQAANGFQAFVQQIARFVNSIVDGFASLFGVGAPAKQSALDASAKFVEQLISNYTRINSTITTEPEQRNRFVEGSLGTGSELTVDKSKYSADAQAEAKRMMALQNLLQNAMAGMVNAWESKGNNRSSTGVQLLSQDQAIRSMILDAFKRSYPLPSEAKQAINTALTDQGATAVNDSITISELEQRGDAAKVARQGLNALNAVMFNLREMRRKADELFGKKNILQKIADKSFEITELTKKYEDMNFIGKELVKEIRRSINQSEDVGAGAFMKALGITKGRNATLKASEAWVQSNLGAFTDAITAFAELGIDVATTSPQDIVNAVNAAAANDARIAPLQDAGRLALAHQFARKRKMVMNLLATRRHGEAGALRSIINMAMSDRPDAVDIAKRDLPKLKSVGAIAARIIDELDTLKKQHRAMIDVAKLTAEREQFAVDAEAVLNQEIKALERRLNVESTAESQKLWKAHNGATYWVPGSPNDTEATLFSEGNRRTVKRGEDFDGAQHKVELAAMKAWLDANQQLRGTGNYQMVARQRDELAKAYAEEFDANVRRGPAGMFVRILGSTADRLDQLGMLGAKDAAIMTRRFVARFEQSLRSVDARFFHEYDSLVRQGVELTKLHPSEFKRQYYNRALGYLESRQDLINPALSASDQETLLVSEAIKYMDASTPMSQELKRVVGDVLRRAGRNGDLIMRQSQSMFGLKVADVMKDGRVYLRSPIGHPLTTSARSIHSDTRVMATRMAESWGAPIIVGDVQHAGMTASAISSLYTNERERLNQIMSSRFTEDVLRDFVYPLISKTGVVNFKGPEKLGVVDLCKLENLESAYRQSNGDMVKFAEILNDLEGGDQSTVADFVGQTMATFQRYANELVTISGANSTSIDEDADPGLNFLNARQGEDYPWQWLDYKEYGFQNRTRYLRVMAQFSAFGDGQDGFKKAIGESVKQLESLHSEYVKAQNQLLAGNKAEYERILNEGGNRIARQNAAANLLEIKQIEKSHDLMMRELNGAKQSGGVFAELLGIVSGLTVQGFATAATDTVTLFEAPLRKFGFSKDAIKFIAGSWKLVGDEAINTLAQAIGLQLHRDEASRRENRLLNNFGLADLDAVTSQRGIKALHERYVQELGEELSFSAITTLNKDNWMNLAKEYFRAASVRTAKAGRVFLESGIGQAKSAEDSYATLKLFNPFTQISLWMHRAVARQWLRTVDNAILKAEAYFNDHPSAAQDPEFKFTHKELGYTGRSLTGIKLDNREWEFLSQKLAECGISLEEAARKKMQGIDPLDAGQIQSAMALSQTEILLNTSPVTRPAWSQTSLTGRLITPLIGWSLYKTADVAKTAAGPRNKNDLKSFIGFMEAMMLGVLPISLAYAFVRDEYEEEVLKKKQNVLPIRADETLPLAVMDSAARLGVLGIFGEIPNAIFNQSTAREVSIDSRIFAVNSALSLMRTVGTLYNQGGTVTYQSITRPLVQAVGGSGYLQNFDAINGLAGLDNVESRLSKRINVGNHLRVAGRINELEVRSSKGMVTTSNAVKPHVVNMALAAYANDPAAFRQSYQKALAAAVRQYPGEDPYEKVANSFEAQHPLKSIFSTRPTKTEYQKMLRSLGDESREVQIAIGNLNAYGQQVLTKRGGSGIKPFVGTDEPKRASDYRAMVTR